MRRDETKKRELEILAKEYERKSQLFERKTFVDSTEVLENLGIFIKDKKRLPLGYLKFWPQDFIVEEIPREEKTQTIDMGFFINKEKEFQEGSPTIYATLVKCGLSTIEAIGEIASFLRTENKNIQFAGIKDKDAITSQLISFRNTKIESLKEINSPYFFLKNIYSGKGVVEIGGLKGNEFTVLIRTDDAFQKKEFWENLKKIEREGFYNFFYLQRFGTPRLINWTWGLLILKGEYEKVVLSFLSSPGRRELTYFKKLRNKIKENWKDWQKIEKFLEPFPIIFRNEKRVVSYLKNNPGDFVGALNQIPKQIRLWVFAYSSLLFNKRLSLYLKRDAGPPQKIPLILSRDENDWLFYKDFLLKNKIFSVPFRNLKPFPYIQWKKREIKTKEKVKIHQVKVIPEGIILNFSLPKAAYATTFLSHLFQLVSGHPPRDISSHLVDIKATLGEESLENALNKFKDIIYPKTENIFEKLSQNE
ncbi:tRNA pseudouridine(13) synthase TruD [Patescibacteria group bacterium]